MNKDPKKNKGDKKPLFDKDKFKQGISYVESRSFDNPYEAVPLITRDGKKELLSSAAGKYQFLWKELSENNPELLKGISKEQFLKSPDLQERVMDMAIEGGLNRRPSYFRNAQDIEAEFKNRLGDKWNFRPDEVAALTHFLGRGGTRNYLRSLERGEEYKVAGKVNSSPMGYLADYNKAIGSDIGLGSQDTRLSRDGIEPRLIKQDSTNPFNINNPIKPIEGFSDLSGNDTQQQSKKAKPQETLGGFLENYLTTNEFALGGELGMDCGGPGQPPCKPGTEEFDNTNIKNSNDLYIPVINKLTEIYGENFTEHNDIHPYVRKGLSKAFDYSVIDLSNGSRKIPALDEDLKEFQDLILNTPNEELKELLKKDYSKVNMFNFKKHLPKDVSVWQAIKYGNKFNKLTNQGYTFEKGGFINSNIDPPIDKINNSRNFVGNWIMDPITKKRLSNNLGITEDESTDIMNKGLGNLGRTQVKRYKDNPRQDADFTPYNREIGLYTEPTESLLTHEFTHSLGDVDKRLSKVIQEKYGAIPTAGITNPNEREHIEYLNRNGEFYPRLMEMRQFLNVKPGDIISDEQIKSLKSNERTGKMFKYYDQSQIKDMLNTIADSSGMTETNNAAMGGIQKNNNMNELLTEFNTGGTHEQNPLGGIPQGMGANGKMNTVEEGETKSGNYVFSNRLKISKELAKKHKLERSAIGKSFAEYSKVLNDINKESNNQIDKDTVKEMLGRVTMAQEDEKSTQAPQVGLGTNAAFLGGQQSQGQGAGAMGNVLNMFGKGMQKSPEDTVIAGDQGTNAAVDGVKDTVAGVIGPIGQVFRGVQKLGQGIGDSIGGDGGAAVADIFSPEESTIANFKDKDLNFGQKLLGTVPGLGGVIAKQSKEAKQYEAQNRATMAHNNLFNNDFWDGGKLDKVETIKTPGLWDIVPGPNSAPSKQYIAPQEPEKELGLSGWFNDNKEKIGNFGVDAMRYAPAAMNLFQLSQLKKPINERLGRLDNSYQRNYVDENSMINKIDTQGANVRRALTESSGGDQGALRSNLLMNSLNTTKGVSDAFLQADNINRGEDRYGSQFDLNVSSTNLNQSNQEKDINARREAAYDNNRSKFLSAIGDNIGAIGLENLRKKYPNRAGLLYDYLGKLNN